MTAENDIRVYGLNVPGEPYSLALVRMIMTHLAEMAGFPEEDVGKIEIAVDEACTNVIEHAYQSLTPKPPIRVEVRAGQDRFVVDILDEGESFDFGNYVMPRFPDHWDEGNTHGVGVYIITQCMDESEYSRLPDKTNRLRLVKKLGPAVEVAQ